MIGETATMIGEGLFGLAHLGFVIGLTIWGRRIAAARGTRAWRLASYMPIAGVITTLIGIAGTVFGLVSAFGAVSHVDPSSRAARLADGIRVAMFSTAIGLGLATFLYVASLIAFLYGSYGNRPR